ncbi:LacI family DNA-binding transcriptional regulator [Novosphingobium sp. BL-8A]|uniref:LacI family DNA-binding transcriptional regulator n=1 Tax=Novosphingobium sp. BL-8A TaxID=3127639 RepID=UPI003757732A
MRPVTLDDVAARVGVSGKTVSRVVNGDAHVSPETRKRVEEAVRDLGYRPNLAARSLATARSNLIALFTPTSGLSHFFSELTHSAIRTCRKHDHNLVVEEFDMHAPQVAEIYRRGLRSLGCDGMILPSPVCDDLALLDALDADGVRYVRISPAKEIDRAPAIISDHASGARAVARHFWSLGHRRFGVVTGLPHQASSPIRRDAFIAGILESGGSLSDIAILEMQDLRSGLGPGSHRGMDLGRAAAASLLQHSPRPDAIFTYNDELAAGLISGARDLGIDVPSQLSVAGFDDSEAARLCWPAITTVRQPISSIAAQAVTILVSQEVPESRTIVCPVELIIRDSTGHRTS